MSRFPTVRRIPLPFTAAALALALLAMPACWELDDDTTVEGNFALEYADNLRVYLGDELIAEIDASTGGTIPLTDELSLEYDELCSDEDTICPSEAYWDEVAIEQPLGSDNALLNAVNIGTIGTEGARLAGLMDNRRDFALLLGLSAGASDNCLAVGVSTAEGSLRRSAGATRGAIYDRIEDGVIALEYAAGCAIAEDVVLGTTLRFETDFTGVRTGDLDTGDVDAEPPMDEDGNPLDSKPRER